MNAPPLAASVWGGSPAKEGAPGRRNGHDREGGCGERLREGAGPPGRANGARAQGAAAVHSLRPGEPTFRQSRLRPPHVPAHTRADTRARAPGSRAGGGWSTATAPGNALQLPASEGCGARAPRPRRPRLTCPRLAPGPSHMDPHNLTPPRPRAAGRSRSPSRRRSASEREREAEAQAEPAGGRAGGGRGAARGGERRGGSAGAARGPGRGRRPRGRRPPQARGARSLARSPALTPAASQPASPARVPAALRPHRLCPAPLPVHAPPHPRRLQKAAPGLVRGFADCPGSGLPLARGMQLSFH